MGDPCHSLVHHALGGGTVADVLLWRRRCASLTLLISSTVLWFLFERAGYNLLSFIANVLLLIVFILFFWAKSATLLNRPLPPIPDMEVPEEFVVKVADTMRVWVNHILLIAHDIAIGGNLKLFGWVALGLWLISYVGSFFTFLTLLYMGTLFSLSVPLIYEKYQIQIDDKLIIAQKFIQKQYKKIDDNVLKKILKSSNKEKKTQ
ncbi:reticulon-like protein B11 [Lycium ferocissimum]|uniref:reticulon-like protein B11 n=1 Tax=Lycium ferocissimum TaxID=112874 RepID=UPI002814A313|nr:reticulon-like protein B11 [Lycium ferocissimum]